MLRSVYYTFSLQQHNKTKIHRFQQQYHQKNKLYNYRKFPQVPNFRSNKVGSVIVTAAASDDFNERYSGFSTWTVEEIERAIQQLGFSSQGIFQKTELISRLREIVHFILEDPYVQHDGQVNSEPIPVSTLKYAEVKARLNKIGIKNLESMSKVEMQQLLLQIYKLKPVAEQMVFNQQEYLSSLMYQDADEAKKEFLDIIGEETEEYNSIKQVLSTLRNKKLREACASRGLYTSGKKEELVERLYESILEEIRMGDLLPGLKDIQDELYEIGEVELQQKQSQEEATAEVQTEDETRKRKQTKIAIEAMSYGDLQDFLGKRGLKIGGKKADLINRALKYIEKNPDQYLDIEPELQEQEIAEEDIHSDLTTQKDFAELLDEEQLEDEEEEVEETDEFGEEQETDEFEEEGLEDSAPTEEQLEEIREKIHRMTVRQIKEELDSKDLPTAGTRQLVENRLFQHMKGELRQKLKEEAKLTAKVVKDIKESSIEALNRMKQRDDPPTKIAVICGGVNVAERKASWSAVQTIMQHLADDMQMEDLWIAQYLSSDEMEVTTRYGLEFYYYYFDSQMRIYQVSDAILSLYQRESIDFAIQGNAVPYLQYEEFINEIKQMDVAIPTFYGDFGEKGTLLDVLDAKGIPHVGTVQSNFEHVADRAGLYTCMMNKGFPIPPSLPLDRKLVMDWAQKRDGAVKVMEYIQKITTEKGDILDDLDNPIVNHNYWPLSFMLRSDENEDYDEKDLLHAQKQQQLFLQEAYQQLIGIEPEPDEYEKALQLALALRNQPAKIRDLFDKQGKRKPYFKIKSFEDLLEEEQQFNNVQRQLKQVDVPVLDIENYIYQWLDAQGLDINSLIIVKPSLKIGGPAEDTTYMARGWQGALFCAYKAFQKHVDCDYMVLQAPMDQHVPFQVGVVETDHGPMAFTPTELREVDLDQDIAIYEMHRLNHHFKLKSEEKTAVIEDDIGQKIFAEREPVRFHTRRQLTPAAVSLHLVQQIRKGAERLFTDLGLKNFAMIHGRVIINQEYVRKEEEEFFQRFGEGPRYYYDSSVSEGQFMQRWWQDHQLTKRLLSEYNYEHGENEPEWTGRELKVNEMVEAARTSTSEDLFTPISPLNDELYEQLDPEEFEEDAARRARLSHGNREPYEFQDEFFDNRDIRLDHSLEEGDQDEVEEDWLWRNESEDSKEEYEKGVKEIDDALEELQQKEEEEKEAALDAAVDFVQNQSAKDICKSQWGLVLFDDVEANVDLSPSSIFFQQASQIGLDHRRVLRHILSHRIVQHGLKALVPMPPFFNIESALFETAEKPSYYKYLAEHQLFEVPYEWGEEEKLFEFQEKFEILSERAKQSASGLAEPWQDSTSQGQYWGNYRAPKGGFIGDDNVNVIVPHPDVAKYDPPKRQKVWVLMGGDGDERNLSLASGINVWRQLREYHDVEAEACILTPILSGEREIQRRHDLLQIRSKLLKSGVPEAEIDPEYQIQNIRRPFRLSSLEPDFEWRGVYILPYHVALLSTIDEIMEAVEREHRIMSTVPHALEIYEKDYVEIREYVQQDFADADVPQVGGLWWGDADQLGPKPRYLDLKRFVLESVFDNAVIFNCVRGEQGENGQLSQLVEQMGGVMTGSSHISCAQCSTLLGVREQLKDLESYGVKAPKRLFVPAIEVISCMEEDSLIAHRFIERMKQELDEPDAPGIIIRPDVPACRHGQIYVVHPEDLQCYAIAIRNNVPGIPGQLLYNSPDVIMPSLLPNSYIVEPAMALSSPSIRSEVNDVPTMSVQGNSGWVKLRVALLGELGEMECLPPALPTIIQSQNLYRKADEVIDIIPPPPHLFPPEILDTIVERLELAANQLQLHGLVELDVTASIDNGDVVINDVALVPDLSQDSFIHRASTASGKCSRELFRTMVSLALVQRVHEIVQQDERKEITGGSYEGEAQEDEELDELDMDEEESSQQKSQQEEEEEEEEGEIKEEDDYSKMMEQSDEDQEQPDDW